MHFFGHPANRLPGILQLVHAVGIADQEVGRCRIRAEPHVLHGMRERLEDLAIGGAEQFGTIAALRNKVGRIWIRTEPLTVGVSRVRPNDAIARRMAQFSGRGHIVNYKESPPCVRHELDRGDRVGEGRG